MDEAHQRFLHDHATDVEEAHERGEFKGVAKVARNMKRRGDSIDSIIEATGLSAADIDRLD